MLYGNCVSCNFYLKDGNVRSVARVAKQGEDMRYCCNDTECLKKAQEQGWYARSYSGKQTVDQPGEKGSFLLD